MKNQSRSRIIAIPLITTISGSKKNGTRTRRRREKEKKKGQGFLNGNRKDTFEDCLDSTYTERFERNEKVARRDKKASRLIYVNRRS